MIDPQLPKSLQHLIEKREGTERRKSERRSNAKSNAVAGERRKKQRRSTSRRKNKGKS